ncbi:Uncharacterized protein TCM_006058 [Theobroma cacao]|uniref:TF-B3 domain-containing protein n=1 Tax=Theobroma cacao TaxID=3641 RepID=A0A061DVU1_THECC|nr:Uncharacterized protein TCM_006058 [Theobroma cacao]
MARIFEINLAKYHVGKLRFHYDGQALPAGDATLEVRGGLGETWEFFCKKEGSNDFSIYGDQWRRFAASRLNATITLSKEDNENFYRIEVRQFV